MGRIKTDFNVLIDMLRNDGSIIINKNLNFALGIEPTMIYSELASKYNYFNTRRDLTIDGFFYCTVDDLYLSTGIPDKRQAKAIKILKDKGLIDIDQRGIPKMRYFKIIDDFEVLRDVLLEGREKQIEIKEKLENKRKVSQSQYLQHKRQNGGYVYSKTADM